ncbi:MAG: GNAT family N-acetyltransferase [Proteiniphilum sp.]|jgi:ribosomal protein S18 acetylase RimI-like enzyme|uniref:GNAT family N-acetyltransferase n=1 Tax=Proteiniphilum sp. TaxID=1926877 RepID=UPI002B20E741|nr:GNAT family N-acetyltransferase [Proteiniphilum sp.]MEA5129393.1 GNAT family N-acetyltransferase [Proteiniphilum sp.]
MNNHTPVSTHECDFTNEADLKAVGTLMNAYIKDQYGGGELLNMSRQLHLVDALNEHPKSIVLLAEIDHVRCGMIVAFENFSTFSVRPMINIHDVIVLEEYRGKGVGKRLMEAIELIARERQCSRITLEVREDNVVAQRLYKKMGFGETAPPMLYWRKYLE